MAAAAVVVFSSRGIRDLIFGLGVRSQEPSSQLDQEMKEMKKSTPTKTITDNNSTTNKRRRELEEEGRASKAIRTHSTQREKSKRTNDESKGEPNSKFLRTH